MSDDQIYHNWLTAPKDQVFTELAKSCGISREMLYRKIEHWELSSKIETMLDVVLRLISSADDLKPAEMECLNFLQDWVNKHKIKGGK
jgi:Zn-dependent peptidase ImmA (M78 family)